MGIIAGVSFGVDVHFHDDQHDINITMCADVPFDTNFFPSIDYTVNSWTFWFDNTT